MRFKYIINRMFTSYFSCVDNVKSMIIFIKTFLTIFCLIMSTVMIGIFTVGYDDIQFILRIILISLFCLFIINIIFLIWNYKILDLKKND